MQCLSCRLCLVEWRSVQDSGVKSPTNMEEKWSVIVPLKVIYILQCFLFLLLLVKLIGPSLLVMI